MILEVRELKKYFPIARSIFRAGGEFVKAVDGVSFSLAGQDTLGIVGESGCGKTTLAKLILKLLEPTSGEIIFAPLIQKLRKEVGIIFQDPLLSLDPRMQVKDILLEPLIVWGFKKNDGRINDLLDLTGLNKNILRRFPAQLSGGQRQRVSIARSLAVCPKLLVLDEPLSSLDLITQKQILELLLNLKARMGLTYIFISHNIAVVKKIASRVIVMFEGRLVEEGAAFEVFSHPKSDYTKKLLEAAG